MKKLTSILLALLMALTLLPTAVFAESTQANGLPEAVNGVYTLTSDVTLKDNVTVSAENKGISENTGVIEIKATGKMVFDGNNKTITAGDFLSSAKNHVINVSSGDVTIRNLTIKGNKDVRIGINVYSLGTKVTLENVTIENCGGAAVIVNSAEVTATNLTTSGSGWGYAVNVDKGGKLTLDTTANLAESFKVYSEKRDDSQCVVNIGNNSQYVLATDTGYCYSSKASDLGVAAIGKNVYATLTDAVAAIEENRAGTITLLKDCEGDGVVVNGGKGITFDLNGHKYTINKTVGSAGTKTNGMQFIKNSTVTIKNGEIVFNNAKMGIKNYSDLTLDNVVMTNTAKADPVVNNCGQLTVNGAHTKISSNYKWAITTGNYGKGDVITTTINAGEISGVAIETPQWETLNSTPNESVTTTVNGGTIGKLGTWDWATGGSYGDEYKDPPQLTNWKFIVNDGTFETFDFSGKYTDKVSFYGGTFGVNPAAYVHDANYAVTKGVDGKYTVAKVTSNNSTSSVILPSTDSSSESSTSTSTSASIPASDIDANKELVIKNDTATTSVTFNSAAAESIKDKGALTLTVTTVDGKNNANVDDSNKTAYTEATKNTSTTNAVVVSIDLKDNDGKNVFTGADGAYAIVAVPYKTGMKNVTVHHLGANGAVTKLGLASSANLTANDTFYYDSVNGVITMRLAHFSQYLINADKTSTPYHPRPIGSGTTTTTTTGKAQSPTTFDAGIAIYGVMAVSSVLGMGYMGKKKFF